MTPPLPYLPELGHYALILALLVAVTQAVLPVMGYRRGDTRLMAVGTSAAQVQFALVLLAYAVLTLCFVEGDFSVAYVASNSHTDLPLIYRITAVWGAHEGSLLLWILMLAGWTFAVSLFNRRLPADLVALVLAVLGAVAVGFLALLLVTSNPFDRLFPVPAEGRDLNPLLQDPGMIVHPPTLYMGYVGFSVVFAFAIAALISGRLDAAWARWTRPWTTIAWVWLTMGITLGSWWAYHELGWGGWWFWDPVENASFMPWLVGTALIHSLAVTEKRGLLKSWTVLLAIFAFALSLLGTFLVRSGVLVSVHAFASDPERGLFVLGFLGLTVGSSLMLYAVRASRLINDGQLELFSREGLLLLNNVFLVAAAAAVLIGTLAPMVYDVIGARSLSVGPPYFNLVFPLLMAPLVLMVGASGAIGWKHARAAELSNKLRWPALVALLVGGALPFTMRHDTQWLSWVGAIFACWAIAGAFAEVIARVRSKRRFADGLRSVPRAIWGMTLAHAGLGIWVLGVTFAGLYAVERDVRLAPGQQADIGPYAFQFEGVKEAQGPNYQSSLGAVRVFDGNRQIAELEPEKRFYPSQRSMMTEAAVDHTPLRDLYVSLGEPLDGDDWSLRLYYKPLIRLVWGGGVLMAIGGVLAASDRRYRLLAERRARSAADSAAGAAA